MFKSVLYKSLEAARMFIFSAYFQKYELFGDRCAEQPMADLEFSNSGLNIWRIETEMTFHSNRYGKISLFPTKITISFIANIYIAPEKQIISCRVCAQPLQFGSESALYQCYNNV